MPVEEQLRIFAAMAACGAGMGAAYDLLSGCVCVLGGSGLLRGAADLVFGPCFAAVLVLAGLRLTTPVFRLFILCGAALGFGAYQLTMGRMLRLVVSKVRGISKKAG